MDKYLISCSVLVEMAELTCHCLNVTVHLENTEVKFGSSLKPSDLQINMKKSSNFEQLHEVNLGVAGITVVSCCMCVHTYVHVCSLMPTILCSFYRHTSVWCILTNQETG